MCGGPSGPGVPRRTQITPSLASVGPWQYQSLDMGTGRVGTGWVLHPLSHPPIRQLASTGPPATTDHGQHGVLTGSLRSTKEILGVDNAPVSGYRTCIWLQHPVSGYRTLYLRLVPLYLRLVPRI